MLEHIVHQNRPAKGDVVGVIERNVIVKFAITQVEIQDRPAAAPAKCVRRGAKALFPLVKSAEVA